MAHLIGHILFVTCKIDHLQFPMSNYKMVFMRITVILRVSSFQKGIYTVTCEQFKSAILTCFPPGLKTPIRPRVRANLPSLIMATIALVCDFFLALMYLPDRPAPLPPAYSPFTPLHASPAKQLK